MSEARAKPASTGLRRGVRLEIVGVLALIAGAIGAAAGVAALGHKDPTNHYEAENQYFGPTVVEAEPQATAPAAVEEQVPRAEPATAVVEPRAQAVELGALIARQQSSAAPRRASPSSPAHFERPRPDVAAPAPQQSMSFSEVPDEAPRPKPARDPNFLSYSEVPSQ